jgi:hypothetical protein
VAVRFSLQPLLQPLPHPFPAFGENFHLYFT